VVVPRSFLTDAEGEGRDDAPGSARVEHAMLQQVVQATPHAMFVLDEDGAVTVANAATERMFGRSRTDLLTTTIEQLIPGRFHGGRTFPTDGHFARPGYPSATVGAVMGRHADGTEFPLQVALNPVQVGEEVRMLASVVDITERMRSEERLTSIIEAAPNAMVMVNAAGIIVQVNAETERSFGYSRDELISMDVEVLLPERLRAEHHDLRSVFFEQPDTRDVGAGRDLFGLRRDGSEFPVEIGLTPILILDEQHVLASILDISARLQVQAVETARHADVLRRSILDSLPFSIIASERDGTIVTANPAAERLLGFDRDELVGSPVDALRDGAGSHMPLIATRPDAVDEREVDYRRKDGSVVPVNEAIALIDTGDGDVSGFLSVAYDITMRREAETFIRHMAHYDFLTDLPNRTKLFERLDDDLRVAVRTGRSVAVVLIDLDHFKRVNDSLGHHVGDDLLVQMAARLKGLARGRDLVARLGGDEFVLVLNGVDSRAQLHDRLTAVLAGIPEPFFCSGHEIIVTASMGVAVSPHAGQDPTMLLKHADTAMYHAKTGSRNSFRWFESAMLDETNDKLVMAAALRRALDRDEITVEYQPQVSLLTGAVTGVEALARWRTADGEEISPGRFIPVAEDNGLIIGLGEWVLRTACVDVARLSAEHGIQLTLAVNVSPRQFQDRGWLDVLGRALAASGLAPEQLELEITEGIVMSDPAETVETLATIRAMGVSIVIDDFGTGFSSLAYLTRFTIDKLKIDRSFVTAMASGAADAAIVNTIIVMAHALGMSVVAEGVETLDQEDYLSARGCDIAQGFRYSRAVPVGELVDAMERCLSPADGPLPDRPLAR